MEREELKAPSGTRSELKILRDALGSGPAKLLLQLAHVAMVAVVGVDGWKIGPVPARNIYEWPGLGCSSAAFRKWCCELIDAGLLRITVRPGEDGYVYELLGMENLPIEQCVCEYVLERRIYKAMDEALKAVRTRSA